AGRAAGRRRRGTGSAGVGTRPSGDGNLAAARPHRSTPKPLIQQVFRALTEVLQNPVCGPDIFQFAPMTQSVTQLYGRKVSKGTNWITVIAMTLFHIGAVAAFFFFDWGAILATVI